MKFLDLFRRKSPEPAAERETDGFFLTHAPARMDKFDKETHREGVIKKSIQTDIAAGPIVDAKGHAIAMDQSIEAAKLSAGIQTFVPEHQLNWYASQGFIGWQMCAIIAQNWLVSKICGRPGLDAVRNGWENTVNAGDIEVPPNVIDAMRGYDKRFDIRGNCEKHIKFARIFGVRHTLFIVDGIDMEAPFNPDGVRPGSYKGMSQIDPYWMSPEFDQESAADPGAPHFYEPTWWRINGGLFKGKRIHRSHFIISRNMDDPADVLKPSYRYGGIPTTQKIYERVYAAERTANEAPLLAMTKRLFTLQTDITKAMADPAKFNETMTAFMAMINNFGCKVTGLDETIGQLDTNLTGLDETIMTQYQLAAASGDVIVTKILETSPKGFNATGEFEMKSYSQFLESIQNNELTPVVDRHNLLVMRSYIMPKFFPGNKDIEITVVWYPTDVPTAKEQAEINKTNAETDKALVDCGAIDGEVVQQRIVSYHRSGYNGIEMPEPREPVDDVVGSEEPKEGDVEV